MVNVVRLSNSVGVPQTVPFDVLNSNPVGRDGWMLHAVISPDPSSSVSKGLIWVLFVTTMSSEVRLTDSGTSSTTVRLNERLTEPPVLLPQTVNSVRGSKAVGVPQIVPLLVPNSSPAGRLGEIAHAVIAPDPVMLNSTGAKAVLFVAQIDVRQVDGVRDLIHDGQVERHVDRSTGVVAPDRVRRPSEELCRCPPDRSVRCSKL